MKDTEIHNLKQLSNIRHEMRSPLSVISGYAYLLSLHENDPERKRWCQAIERSCKTLDGLVGELVRAARQKIEESERKLRGEDSSSENQKNEMEENGL